MLLSLTNLIKLINAHEVSVGAVDPIRTGVLVDPDIGGATAACAVVGVRVGKCAVKNWKRKRN